MLPKTNYFKLILLDRKQAIGRGFDTIIWNFRHDKWHWRGCRIIEKCARFATCDRETFYFEYSITRFFTIHMRILLAVSTTDDKGDNFIIVVLLFFRYFCLCLCSVASTPYSVLFIMPSVVFSSLSLWCPISIFVINFSSIIPIRGIFRAVHSPLHCSKQAINLKQAERKCATNKRKNIHFNFW